MSEMGCHIFNLCQRDFANGGEILLKMAKEHDIKFVASNTFYQDGDKHFTDPWQIVKVKPVKGKSSAVDEITVGVVGFCDQQNLLFARRLKEPLLYSKDPVAVAEKLVPDLRKKVDLVVMLYHGSYKTVKSILEKVKGIDVVIVGGQYYMINEHENLNAVVASTSSMGKYCGILTLTLDGNYKIVGQDKQSLQLDENVPDDPDMLKLLNEFDEAEAKAQDYRPEGNHGQ